MKYNLSDPYGTTLDSGIDVGQEINIGPGKSGKKNNFTVKKEYKFGFTILHITYHQTRSHQYAPITIDSQ